MSGPFGSQQWMYSPYFYPHEIGNCARLNNGTLYTRTPSSSSNADTFTWSAWVKNWGVTTGGYLLSAGVASTREFLIYFDSTNQRLNVYQWNGSTEIQVITSKQFRDPAAWYHIVVAYDSTQGTASNRIKIYVNGEQETSFASAQYPAQGLGSRIGTTEVQDIGRNAYNQNVYSNFYITEVNYISGSQLAPTSFGETKADTWIPKKYAGSYGSHDYYLDFATRATNPIDASGQGNNWTSVGVAAVSWMLDSPTNNFATLNSIETNKATMSEGDLKWTISNAYKYGQATIAIPSTGKYIIECWFSTTPTNSNYNTIGVISTAAFPYLHTHLVTSGRGFYGINDAAGYGQTFVENGGRQGSITVPSGTVIQALVDRDNNQLTFTKNGTLQTGNGATIALPSDGTLWFLVGDYGVTGVVNFGQASDFAGNKTAQGNTDANGLGDFYYAPPAGYLALCTANLPAPVAAFNPAVNNSPQDHFNTALYTGNGSSNGDTQSVNVGLDVDFVWMKNRSSSSTNHTIFDRLRGDVGLNTNVTIAEYSFGDFNMNSNNTIDAPYSSSSSYSLNTNNETYVAWALKAGGSGVSNSDGTITSTVSANTDAGFSIVAYNGSSAGTVGHGLSSTPQLVIQKSRNLSSGGYWWTGTTVIDGSLDYFQLNNTNAKADSGYTAPTSSVFSNVPFTGGTNQVAYCFHSVEGFSKFGSYTGNGVDDGLFIYTGFRPAFVMVKRTDAGNNWVLLDNKRDPHNVAAATIYANENYAENANYIRWDMLSNGFKLRKGGSGWLDQNASAGTYIYIAFAEMPQKYANAR